MKKCPKTPLPLIHIHVFTVERLSGNFLISLPICSNFSSTAIGIGCLPCNRLENYAFTASQISVSWIPIYCVILMCVYEGGSFHWHFHVHDLYNFFIHSFTNIHWICLHHSLHSLTHTERQIERGIRDVAVIITWLWKVNIWYLIIVCFTILRAFTLQSPPRILSRGIYTVELYSVAAEAMKPLGINKPKRTSSLGVTSYCYHYMTHCLQNMLPLPTEQVKQKNVCISYLSGSHFSNI